MRDSAARGNDEMNAYLGFRALDQLPLDLHGDGQDVSITAP
jgi:hypothetical protein